MRRSPDLRPRRRALAAIAAGVLVCASALAARAADDLAVDVVNASEPTLCAEKDNVYLKLMSSQVRRFTIEAEHPAYMGTIVVDRAAPDFGNCDMPTLPPAPNAERPQRRTLFETPELQLVGLTIPNFWRANKVPVRVGGRADSDIQLLQLWTRHQERAEEVLVLYPSDGYWRARPLPPANLRWSAYGSSFLIGPVETAGRPFVAIASVDFDPATLTFRIAFARGGAATLRVEKLDEERIVLDVGFEVPITGDVPFAALRSMFVTDANADVAQVRWRAKDSEVWRQEPIMAFGKASAVALWAGRAVVSRHNTSAPDMVFRDFRAGP
jgi:hypothetical protein